MISFVMPRPGSVVKFPWKFGDISIKTYTKLTADLAVPTRISPIATLAVAWERNNQQKISLWNHYRPKKWETFTLAWILEHFDPKAYRLISREVHQENHDDFLEYLANQYDA
jgi:hypothetical protein